MSAAESERQVAVQHGVDCPKAAHVNGGELHAPDDDRPFDVDGLSYCGRCHCYLPGGSLNAPALKEAA